MQLSTIKSVGKRKISLLEFCIHSIRKHSPDILKFSQELVHCELASKIDLSILDGKVKEFEAGLGKVKKELAKTEEKI